MSNIHSSPGDYGLEVLGELDLGGGWDFDMWVVWWHEESKTAYWGHDSGCSCPSPFEGYYKLEDLEEFTVGSLIVSLPNTDEGRTFHSEMVRAIKDKRS